MSQKPEIAFYHLTQLQAEAVLPSLLAKTLDLGKRAVVRTASEASAIEMDQKLWAYENPAFWLPHATEKTLGKEAKAEDQPIWITGPESPPQRPNQAQFLFQIDGGCASEELRPYERVFDLFNGNDALCLQEARKRWKRLRDENHFILTYWRQNMSGEWSKESTYSPKERAREG